MKALTLILSLLSFSAFAMDYGYDRVVAEDGTRCEASVVADYSIEMGIEGGTDYREDDWRNNYYDRFQSNQDAVKGFMKVVIPVGHNKKRVDCSRLYENELARKTLELEKLRREMELLTGQHDHYTFGN